MATGLWITPIASAELPDFIRSQKAAYIQDRVEFGGEDVAEATSTAERQFAAIFPDGTPGPEHHLFVARDQAGARVGILWLHHQPGNRVFIYDIEIDESSRGNGWGRQLMHFAESWARDRRAPQIELNVFGGNTIARQLYRSLGYRETSVQMRMRLTDKG